MPAKTTRPAESWSYVLECDRELDAAEQSRFILRPLTQSERAAVRDDIARVETAKDGARSVVSRSQRQGIELAINHIVSIENFPAGAPQPWPPDPATRRSYLEMLRDDYVQEVANEIWAKSVVGDDLKNS